MHDRFTSQVSYRFRWRSGGPGVDRRAGARAQATVTLKLHHFLPPVSNGHAKMLVPWIKKVEAELGGKIKIDIFPSMQLGGTPPQLYDQARDGVVDIVWTLPGSTPGRFPTTEVFELPFIGAKLGIVNARAAQEFADTYLKDEVKDVKLLSYWAHDAGLIHASRQVTTMEDLKGLKLRNPTRLAGEGLKALGGTRSACRCRRCRRAWRRRSSTARSSRGKSCRPSRCTSS